ncbi:hypothetical protein Y032_0701g1651 [Ancylostoma ceylanicum]|uniref:Secreted protein n=1 Tax=Ancylostoma ceylanicum TaxID=53326 RepID=A0A016WFV0_9BILA|nr:hypothetical protein Y032_0701g1651 [Ancylostoma ceylanicum]
MLMHDLLLQLLLFGQLVHTELPRTPPHPLLLLERDLENLSCLFFRRNCTNHLADLSSADRLFWKVRTHGDVAQMGRGLHMMGRSVSFTPS